MDSVYLQCMVIQLLTLASYSWDDYGPVRPCNDDYQTPGRCFVLGNQSLDWHAADDFCKEKLPVHGFLAAIEDANSQTIVANIVASKGWEQTWINGCLKDRYWFWQKHWDFLNFQGCFRDEASNPDLPYSLSVTSGTKPSDCFEMCKTTYDNDDSFVLSVQRDQNGEIVCRCGREFNNKHGRSYNSACHSPCPQSGGLMVGEVMNKYCGGVGHQLVYFGKGDKGTKFHAFADPASRSYDHCAVFDHRFNHQWAEHSCNDKLPFICDYDVSEYDCTARRNYHWVSGTCVTLETDPKSFYDAQAFCFEYYGDLLKVSNAEIYNAVKKLLDTNKSYFFALTDEEWVFSTWGLVFRYYNWGTNQPADGPGQICFMMKKTDNYKWYNIDCHARLPFVCMVDIEEEEEEEFDPSTTMTPGHELPYTPTSGPGNGGGQDKEGISKDLLIGVGAGAGGAFLIALVAGICVCCCIRHRNQEQKKKQREDVPTPPQGQPPEAPQGRSPGRMQIVNPAYHPDAERRHQQAERGPGDGTSFEDPNYMDIDLGGYDDVDRRSDHRYTQLERDTYEYLEPIPSTRKQ